MSTFGNGSPEEQLAEDAAATVRSYRAEYLVRDFHGDEVWEGTLVYFATPEEAKAHEAKSMLSQLIKLTTAGNRIRECKEPVNSRWDFQANQWSRI